MISVAIKERGKVTGRVLLDDDRLSVEPAGDPLLQNIVNDSIYARGRNISPHEEPDNFIRSLHLHYRNPYLCACRAEERVENRDVSGEPRDSGGRWTESGEWSQHPGKVDLLHLPDRAGMR